MKTFKQFKKMNEAVVAPIKVPGGLGNYVPSPTPPPVVKRTPDSYKTGLKSTVSAPKTSPRPAPAPNRRANPSVTGKSIRPKENPDAQIRRDAKQDVINRRKKLLRQTSDNNKGNNSVAQDLANDARRVDGAKRSVPSSKWQKDFKTYRNGRPSPYRMFNRPLSRDI